MLELWLSGARGCCWNENRGPGGTTTHPHTLEPNQDATANTQVQKLQGGGGTKLTEVAATNGTKIRDTSTVVLVAGPG